MPRARARSCRLRSLRAVALASVTACAARPSAEALFVPEVVAIPATPEPLPEKPGDTVRTELDDGPIVDLLPDRRPDGGARGDEILPVTWRAAFDQTRLFADAIRLARQSRGSCEASAVALGASVDAGPPTAKRFEEARALFDKCNRAFAAAYHAPDATEEDRLTALAEAAAMLLAFSQRLASAGLTHAPQALRSDPAVALTFEDVAHGPVQRWRQEAVALLGLCASARGAADSPAGRSCLALRRGPDRARGKPDAGRTPNGCACAPGDPLCSASMSGWCHPGS
jgi:hypothetical protein